MKRWRITYHDGVHSTAYGDMTVFPGQDFFTVVDEKDKITYYSWHTVKKVEQQ